MLKEVLWTISLSLFLFSCGKKATFRVEGELSNLEDKTLYAVFEGENVKSVDTVVCGKGNMFKFENNTPAYKVLTLYFNQKTKWITIYLEPKKLIKIKGDALYPELVEIEGGKVNDDLTAFKQGEKALLKEKGNILKNLKEANADIDGNNLLSKLTNVNHSLSEAAIKYIRQNPGELASAVLIQTYFSDPDDTRKMDELLALLSPEIKESAIVKEMEQFSAIVKRTSVGAEAPDFFVKDILSNDLTLSSFANRYLLLTFAAPWCDICKTENRYLKEIRKAFPKEKLEMLTITLDEDLPQVREMMKTDSITWKLVSDSAGYASMMIDLYGVGAIPRNFIIDNNRKIVLKTENGAEVQQMLEKLID